MSRLLILARVSLSGGRWLLPWLSVLLVSASLVWAMTATASGSRAPADGQRQETVTAIPFSVPPGSVVTDGSDGRGVDRPCAALFGSYNGWLFGSGGHGPCGLESDAAVGSPPDR